MVLAWRDADYRYFRILFVLGLLIGSVAAGGVAAGPVTEKTTLDQRTITGPLVPIPGEFRSDFRTTMRQAARKYGYEPRSNVSFLHANGVTWIVATSQPSTAGLATASGPVIGPEEFDGELGVIFAEQMDIDTTGKRVSRRNLSRNTERYVGRLVRTDGYLAQVTYSGDVADATARYTVGILGENPGIRPVSQPPGQAARHGTVNLSNGSSLPIEARSQAAFKPFLATSGNQSLFLLGHARTDWWIDGDSTVDLLVLPADSPIGGGDSPILFPVETQVDSTATVTPATLQRRASELEGDLVTVRGDAIGRRLSTKELLLATARCAPESVLAPVFGCVPIVTDTTLHTGVIYSPGKGDTAIPYAGVSNDQQATIMEAETGHYLVSGRVVEASALDPRLRSDYGLLVYQRTRVDNLRREVNVSTAEQLFSVNETLASQATLSSAAYTDVEAAATTPTPTVTPTPTATPEPANVLLLDAEYKENPVTDGRTVWVRATVRNTGGKAGEITLRLSNMVREKEKTVRVPPKTKTPVLIGMTFDRTARTKTLHLNGNRLGKVRFIGESTTHTPHTSTSASGFNIVGAVVAMFILLAKRNFRPT